jgi:uncharacterized membrane protein
MDVHRTTPIVAGVVGLCVIAACVFVFRPLATLALIFVLPGWLLMRNMGPSPGPGFESVVLAIGMSIALVIVLALPLNALGALTPSGWLLALGVFCLLAFQWRRRSLLSAKDHAQIHAPATAPGAALRPSRIAGPAPLTCMATVALLVIAAFALARSGAVAHQQFSFTEFWMLPQDGAGHGPLVVGIRNKEKQPVSYDLELLLNGMLFKRDRNLVLANNEELMVRIAPPVDGTRLKQRVEARLYRNQPRPVLYRRVVLSNESEGLR